jgi:queuosine precursor transporter
MNELIFLLYLFIVSSATLGALWLGSHALVTLMALQWVLANLFVTKQIVLFGLTVTASDALAVGATLCLNVLQEYYGRMLSRQAIIIGFCATSFYTILSFMQILYCPASVDIAHEHFCALLNPMPRLIIASMTTYLIVQMLDYKLYGFLKRIFPKQSLIMRNYFSIGVTQALDTILFSILGLYGIVSSLTTIIVVSYAIKLAVLFFAAPFVALSKYVPHSNK